MGDAEPDRRPEVEPPPAPARALAPREPRPHRAREPFGDLGGLGALPLALERRDVLLRHRLLRRRAAAPPAAVRGGVLAPAGAADAGRLRLAVAPAWTMLEAPGRAGGQRLGVDPGDALHAARAPVGVEEVIEPREVRAARREQGAQSGAQAFGPLGQRAGDHPRGVLRLRLPDDEAGVAQGGDEAREAPSHRRARTGAFDRESMRAHQAMSLMRSGRRAGSSSLD